MNTLKPATLTEFIGTKEEQTALSNISEMTADILRRDHNINITMPAAIPTIIFEFFNSAIGELKKMENTNEDDIRINIMNMLTLGVTYRGSEDGEKDGNYTPYVIPGTIMKTSLKSDTDTDE